jgi:eukaryotic-like serine/threonine-protein kinase
MTPERFQKIEELYHAAREGTAEQRAALLSQTDPELRRELESLLAQHAGDEFLDRPAIQNAPQLLEDSTLTDLAGHANLGPYRIEGKLGEGGMGEVFRAVDTRLGRAVAIKTTREHFSDRFEREARAISSLNHPGICTLYDVGPNYLVMELVEGETIAARLKSGPLPVTTALLYASQIAAALAEAHSKGIVHRDLKPANIMIAKSGIKVLDFGLAKSGEDETVTASHMVMGTPAYMAPEQREGKPADVRADIYSFGCVLYEMLTGARAGSQRKRVPSRNLERIVSRCLQEDPGQRWQSAAELERELAAVTATGGRRKRMLAATVAIAAALMAAIAGWYFAVHKRPVTSHSEYVQLTDFSDSAAAPALSPDGRIVAFFRSGTPFLTSGQIYVKLLPDGQSTQITNDPKDKYNPVFTPDGSRVAYTAITRPDGFWDTWTVPVTGGSPTRFIKNAAGLSWIGDGRVLFSEIMPGTLLHMGIVTSEESRAGERAIYFPDHMRAMAHYSYLSPDRKSLLVVEMDGTTAWLPCRLLPWEGGSKGRQVGPAGACIAAGWSPDGKWMYFNAAVHGATHLWRQRFPDGVTEQITFGPGEEEGLAIPPDGKSLIASVGVRKSSVWLHDGQGERLISPEGSVSFPRITSDGKRVYYLLRKNGSNVDELWSTDGASGKANPSMAGVSMLDFDISPDEQQVAFTTGTGKGDEVFVAPLDASAPPRQVVRGGDSVSFGAPGELLFRQLGPDANYLARVKTDGGGLERVLDQPISDKGNVSPDGAWVAAMGIGASKHGTVAVSLKDGTRKTICGGICLPKWSPDGLFLYVTISAPLPTVSGVDPTSAGTTLVLAIPRGQDLPSLPEGGVGVNAIDDMPGVRVIRQGQVVPGPGPETYAFARSEFVGNLFRIPLH